MSTSSAVRAHRKEPSKAVAKLTSATRLPPISSAVGVAKKKRGGAGAAKRREQDVNTLKAFEETEFNVSNGVHATNLLPGLIDEAAARGFSNPPPEVAQAASQLYSPLRPEALVGGYAQEEGSADWCAIVVCVDSHVSSTISLRFPLAAREPNVDDDNAVGLLFALPLEESPWRAEGCSGPRIDVQSLASPNLLEGVREDRKRRGARPRVLGTGSTLRTRGGTTLSTVCAQDRIPHCLSIHWGHRALCSLLLPPHEPLQDWDEQFWCVSVRSEHDTALARLLVSKKHRAPAAVEFFTICNELYALLRSLETPI